MKTEITVQQLQQMTDKEVINHLSKYPYPSQWINETALTHAQYRLALIQGNKYLQTGNIKSFKKY